MLLIVMVSLAIFVNVARNPLHPLASLRRLTIGTCALQTHHDALPRSLQTSNANPSNLRATLEIQCSRQSEIWAFRNVII